MFYTIDSIAPISQKLRAAGCTLVLATGFFDLLHAEHIKFLQKAKRAGDILIVGVESDARAVVVKGQGRPVEPQSTRCRRVGEYADFVITLPDDFDHQEAYESLLSAVRPAVYAVSSHTDYLTNKRKLVAQHGGQLQVVHQFNPSLSTSKIIASRKTPYNTN